MPFLRYLERGPICCQDVFVSPGIDDFGSFDFWFTLDVFKCKNRFNKHSVNTRSLLRHVRPLPNAQCPNCGAKGIHKAYDGLENLLGSTR